ncbi:hypothetical protein [Acetobacter thailandicus]|uniref:hypothetical protein n=1 Tax=Acetobacter thailandicus TaxID=1502842 RepID=UPI001BADBC89|nr:hypothetical protein [Acetobacter thailandicus]MBS0961350.1 hypothetical protein [Acetobacter thailandicus]
MHYHDTTPAPSKLGWLAEQFDTSVGGDPHLYIHNTLFKMMVTEDGHIDTLDTKQLCQLGIEQHYDPKEEATITSAVP